MAKVATLKGNRPMRDTLLKTFPSLSTREAETLALVAEGLDNATIAATLAISEQSVKNILRILPLKVGTEGGGSARVRLALRAHGIR